MVSLAPSSSHAQGHPNTWLTHYLVSIMWSHMNHANWKLIYIYYTYILNSYTPGFTKLPHKKFKAFFETLAVKGLYRNRWKTQIPGSVCSLVMGSSAPDFIGLSCGNIKWSKLLTTIERSIPPTDSPHGQGSALCESIWCEIAKIEDFAGTAEQSRAIGQELPSPIDYQWCGWLHLRLWRLTNSCLRL